jgi:hypothetical protein
MGNVKGSGFDNFLKLLFVSCTDCISESLMVTLLPSMREMLFKLMIKE